MPGEAVLTGELGLLSLFDLGQLLMLNGATGVMTLTDQGRRGYLYFVRGQIVNAVDDEHREGEGAAHHLFTWKGGRFEFRPEPPTDSRAISDSTEGLMMEAARRMDEAGPGELAGAADRLARRASSLEALRLAFDSVANQAMTLPEGADPSSSPFELLKSPTDVLLLRPHDLPRVRLGGRWRAAGPQPLESIAFDQLRTRLLDVLHGGASEGGVRTRVAAHDDGRLYEVTHLPGENEALWVRAAGLAPLGASQLDGPLDEWRDALAGTPGLTLVCGHDAEAADRLLHACVAQMLRERSGTVLIAAEHCRWKHESEHGALVQASGATSALALGALSPEVAVFDHAHAAMSAEALQFATRVVVAVVASGPVPALTRWCARVGRRPGDGIEALLSCAAVDVVHADREPAAGGRVAFGVTRLAFDPGSLTWAPEASTPSAAIVTVAPRMASRARTQEPEAASGAPPSDPMAALAAEITRTLRRAA